MFYQNFGQTFGQLLTVENMNKKFVELQKVSNNRKVRDRKLMTRIERNKQKRYDFIKDRRFGRNDEWSDGSCDDTEFMSEDENEFYQLSQNDIINVFKTTLPLPQFESNLKNAVNNTLNLFETIDYNFGDMNEIEDEFFAIEVLNKITTFIGSDISHFLQVKILKMMKELVFQKDLTHLIMNIECSELALKLVQLIIHGDEELVEHSIAVIEELMNVSNRLIYHLINCGYINALQYRVNQFKWYKTSAQCLKEKHKFNRNRIQIYDNHKNNVNDNQKLPLILSRAVLLLFSTEFNQINAYIECLAPILKKFLTCPDDRVKQNALSTLLMFDQNNNIIKDIIIKILCRDLFNSTISSRDPIIIQVIQLLIKIFKSDRKVVKQTSFLIQIFQYLKNLLIKNNNNNKVIKDVVHCITTIVKNLPINSRFVSGNSKETIEIIRLLLRVDNKLKSDAYYAIKEILQTFSAEELKYLFREFELMKEINQILEANDENCQMIGLEIVSYCLHTISNTDIDIVIDSKIDYIEEIRLSLDQLCWHKNEQISNISQNILKTYIDDSLYQSEDATLLPTSDGKQYLFGIFFSYSYFVF